MSEDGEYSTFVGTEDGKVYDLGKREYPPVHHHPGEAPCPECFVENAWTEKIGPSTPEKSAGRWS